MRFISFAILVSGILLIRKLMWKHISRKTQYTLWIFPALFLLLNPFWNISSRWSIENILFTFEQRTLQETEKYFPELWRESDGFGEDFNNHIYNEQNNGDAVMLNETDEEEGQEEDWNSDTYYNEEETESRYVLTIFPNAIVHFMQKNWSNFRRIISFILILAIGYSNIKFYRFCLKNRHFFKNEKEVKVYFLEGIGSPFLLGKNIYIDKNSIENEMVLKHVIMHEYCHYKHRDYFWIIIRTICLIFYWYHPFVWLANEYAKRDCELACDEAVMLRLDSKEYEEYGYTLISVLKYSRTGKKYTTISSAANQNMKKIKERLIMIKTKRKCSKAVSVICILCIVILTGCTFTQKQVEKEETREKKEVVNQENSDLQLQEDIQKQIYNGYYNISAKAYGNCTYVAAERGMYRIWDDSSIRELLYEGSVILGTLGDERLFFYAYSEDEEGAGIMSLNLLTGEIMSSYFPGEDFYSYMEMYYRDEKLYINKMDEIAVFQVQEDGTLQREESLQITVPKELQDAEKNSKLISPVITMGEGYSENFYYDRTEDYSCVSVYDGNALVNETENMTDLMITDKGVIGSDIKNPKDVFWWDIYTGERKLFYQASEHENKLWVYSTYDKNGVYGFLQGKDGSCVVSRISWDGMLEELFELEAVERYGDVKMSVIGEWIYYCNQTTGEMERRNMMNLEEAEIIR